MKCSLVVPLLLWLLTGSGWAAERVSTTYLSDHLASIEIDASPEAPSTGLFEFSGLTGWVAQAGARSVCTVNRSATVDLLFQLLGRTQSVSASTLATPVSGTATNVVRVLPTGAADPRAGMVCVDGSWSAVRYQAVTVAGPLAFIVGY